MIGLYGEFSTSMKCIKCIGGDASRLLGGYIPPRFAPMLIEFLKNIGKSRDKSCVVEHRQEDFVSVANWYIYIPDFTNLVYFLDRLVGEIMVWYMSLNLVYFYAFW